MTRIVTLGEIMLRLKSLQWERLFQSPLLEATFGGGEANVAVSLARFGRLCCKKYEEKKWSMEQSSQSFLHCNSEQLGNQRDLPSHIPFVHPLQLSFSHHVHHLESL